MLSRRRRNPKKPPRPPRKRDHKKEEKEKGKSCGHCRKTGAHPPGRNCSAYRQQCFKCSKYNHYASCCRIGAQTQEGYNETKRGQTRWWSKRKCDEWISVQSPQGQITRSTLIWSKSQRRIHCNIAEQAWWRTGTPRASSYSSKGRCAPRHS